MTGTGNARDPKLIAGSQSAIDLIFTSDLLARLSHASGHGAAGHDMKNMGER